MYVCDHDKIIYYNVNFHKDYLTVDEGEHLVYGQRLDCGGMSTDKWGNLFYVDRRRQNISKIKGTELEKHFSHHLPGAPFLTNRILYDVA